jgi:hypothetical protein
VLGSKHGIMLGQKELQLRCAMSLIATSLAQPRRVRCRTDWNAFIVLEWG